jgi:flagellar assembly protein FliH
MTRIIRAKAGNQSTHKAKRLGQTRVVRKNELDAKVIVEKMIADATANAQGIRDDAKRDAQLEGQRIVEAAKSHATEIRMRAEVDVAEFVQERREELSTLGVAIARKILGAEIRSSPDVVCQIVSRCLEEAAASRKIILRVNPHDADRISNQLGELNTIAEHAVITLQRDETIPQAGCIIETERGQIDGRLETQLRAIQKGLGRKLED